MPPSLSPLFSPFYDLVSFTLRKSQGLWDMSQPSDTFVVCLVQMIFFKGNSLSLSRSVSSETCIVYDDVSRRKMLLYRAS